MDDPQEYVDQGPSEDQLELIRASIRSQMSRGIRLTRGTFGVSGTFGVPFGSFGPEGWSPDDKRGCCALGCVLLEHQTKPSDPFDYHLPRLAAEETLGCRRGESISFTCGFDGLLFEVADRTAFMQGERASKKWFEAGLAMAAEFSLWYGSF